MNDEVRIRKRASRRDQELAQLARAFFVAPIADPDHVGVLLGRDEAKVFGIGCIVEGLNVLHAESVGVYATDGVAEGEHPVEKMQKQAQQIARAGVSAV